MILHSDDKGKTWEPQESGTDATLNAATMTGNGKQVWVVGNEGTILYTNNMGEKWRNQGSGTKLPLNDIEMAADGLNGWAVGGDGLYGTILHTVDGGNNWTEQWNGKEKSFLSVDMSADGYRVWVLATEDNFDNVIMFTSNNGKKWKDHLLDSSFAFPGFLSFEVAADGKQGVAVGYFGAIMKTDNGFDWDIVFDGFGEYLHMVRTDRQGSTANSTSDDGATLFSDDRGVSWWVAGEKHVELVDIALDSLGDKMWIAGGRGTVFYSKDSGESWLRQSTKTDAWLKDIEIAADGKQGWAFGKDGTIIQTTDGGETWEDAVKYSRYPAPWYYLTWLPVAFLAFLAYRVRPEEEVKKIETVADMLVSDRPLEEGDPDPLDYHTISGGLSRFLRNEKTKPPLTIAITGEWGSGKSSIMNLLKADLESFGFRPVSFNAWHYQKEEHLLASLLENIQAQAIPPIWRQGGLKFRLKLLKLRSKRHWLSLAVVLTAALAASGYLYYDSGTLGEQIDHLLTTVSNTKDAGFKELAGKVISSANLSDYTLVTLIPAIILALLKGASAFGVSPAKLMSSMTGKFSVRDMKAQLSFRHQFQRQFNDVANALNPRTMVILVDDLDRCRPENVLEVLESINFLVSSGPCYVVLGMDPKRVIRCVGLEFKDLADESIDEMGQFEKEKKAEDGGKAWRAAFAKRYLEKLINIEVPVPKPEPAASKALLVPDVQANKSQWFGTTGMFRYAIARLYRILNDHGRKAFTSLIVLFLFYVSFQAGGMLAENASVVVPVTEMGKSVVKGVEVTRK